MRLITALLLAAACLPTALAGAAQSVRLSATLTPNRLGRPASIGLTLQIAAPANKVPPPATQIDLDYPKNLGIALSGLGIETCTATTLELLGPGGCPADSIMGYGTALGEIPFGPEIIKESAIVTIARAEDQDGHIALLFDARGITPVVANVVLPGVLLPAQPPYGGDIRIDVPLIPSLPEAPDVAVVQLTATIGPAAGLRYVEKQGGRTVSYTPKGILLPDRCPRGGFPFATALAFSDGSHASASARVHCPRVKSHRARRGRP